MKISLQNLVISIAAGILVVGLAGGFVGGIDQRLAVIYLVAPSVTAILWAHFSKKEKEDRAKKEQQKTS